MTTPHLTPARRRGLVVLAAGERARKPVYESNQTSRTSAARLTVYWQTVRFLAEGGYITTLYTREGRLLALTPSGRQLARDRVGVATGPPTWWLIRLSPHHPTWHLQRDSHPLAPTECGRDPHTDPDRRPLAAPLPAKRCAVCGPRMTAALQQTRTAKEPV